MLTIRHISSKSQLNPLQYEVNVQLRKPAFQSTFGIEWIKQMSNTNGVTFLRDNVSHIGLSAEAEARIYKISKLCSRHLIEMLQNMFDGIDDSFFELANNARTNNEQNLFFEAMREIRIKRKTIESELEKKIEHLFANDAVLSTKQPNPNSTPNESEFNFESLALVNKEDLEEEVAITSMASKAASNFQGPLLQFQTRVANLYGQSSLDNIRAPLDPKDISKAFAETCSRLEINLKERLIVYKQFDRYVLSNLGYALDEANRYMIKAGILPDLRSSIVKQKHHPKGEAATTPFSHDRQANNAPEQAEYLLPQLQSLLANVRTHSSHGHANAPVNHNNQHHINTEDLVNLLSAIQISTPDTPVENAKVIDIHSHLKTQFQHNPTLKNKEPTLKQLDEDLINLVSMLFEFILEDYNLAAPIQVLISRLQIPILKVVIKDSSFFNVNKHPARKLLNSLARAGIGWSENHNTHQDALYQKIQQTVHSILDNFDGDIQLFEKLNKEFEDFMIKEEKKSKIVEQRTKESEKGLLKSKQAQKAVDAFFTKIFCNTEDALPEIVIDTLKQGWSRVMFLAFLKDDQEHQWLKTCQIAQDLVWCLQPIHSQKDRQHWIVTAPKLLKELKSGLQDVSYHTNSLDETILAIRSSLTHAFKQNTFDEEDTKPTYKSASSIINIQNRSAVERQLAFNGTELEKYSNLIDELAIGTWVEFKLGNNKKLRCKLSTKLEEADTFIFVNRMGLKSLEKSREELANELYKRNAIILEQGLLIDRAMNTIASSLKQKASA